MTTHCTFCGAAGHFAKDCPWHRATFRYCVMCHCAGKIWTEIVEAPSPIEAEAKTNTLGAVALFEEVPELSDASDHYFH